MTRVPAYQVLADDLRVQITSGDLRPGDRLPTEPQLCERSGLSRSTVREALRLLASQHLIVTMRGVTGGSFVAEPSARQVGDSLSTGMQMLLANGTLTARDIIEVAELLEIPAIELAARRRTDEDLAGMEAALYDPVGDDLSHIVETHGRFHMAVAAATGNALYELFSRPFYNVANKAELAGEAPPGFWAQLDADHREILGHISACDPGAAGATARRHIDFIRTAYADQPVRLADAPFS